MNVKNLKKGFTLTELIIVIVIVGILAGVLIPTFINVVNKANRASDLSLVRNLNEALTLDSVENGKHETMYDALQAAQASGFDVSKISKKAKSNEILWDSENDVFCYLNGTNIEYYPNSVSEDKKIKEQIDYYKLWKIYSNVDEIPTTTNQEYSIYLAGNNTGDEKINATINLDGVGFDIGENEFNGASEIIYKDSRSTNTNRRTVVIRTNWGDLTIKEAPYATVKHYNELDELNVVQIANESFHAYGFIAMIVSFAEGRFVAESTASFGQSYEEVVAKLTENELELDSSVSALETVSGIFEQHVFDENGVSKLDSHTINTDASKGVVHVHETMTHYSYKASTCSMQGNIEYWQCPTCNNYYNNEDGAVEHKIGENEWLLDFDSNAHDWKFVDFSYTNNNQFTANNDENQEDKPYAQANYRCDLCNVTDSRSAKVDFHSLVESTCSATGAKVYYASIALNDSLDHLSHNNSDNNGGVGEFIIAIDPNAHNYVFHEFDTTGDTTYVNLWCSHNHDHIGTPTSEGIISVLDEDYLEKKAPTCEDGGKARYILSWDGDGSDNQEYYVVDIPALGHNWDNTTYDWADDHSTVTATRVCSRDSSHIDLETVNTTSNITQEQSCTKPELTTYTASFTNTAFTQQTKVDVETKAASHLWGTPTYEWSENHSTCTATVSCTRCGGEVTEVPTSTSENNIYTAIFTNSLFETQIFEATRDRLYIDDSITLSEDIFDNIIEAIYGSFVGNETEKFINIVFDYSDKAIYNNFNDVEEITPENYYNGLIKVYYKVSNDNLYTLYFLSELDLYLSETAPGFIFGFINMSLDDFYNKTLKFNSFDFTNFHIDSSSNLHNLFAGCIGLYNIDFSKLFENIELPNNKIDKIKFFYNMLDGAFLDNSCTLPNGITVDEINVMPYYIDEFHIRFNRYHISGEDANNDSQTIPNLDFAYELPNFRKQFINFIQGDSNDILDSAQKTILIFECDSDSDNPIGKNDFGGYFVKLTFTVHDETKFGDHGRFVIDDVEFINIKDDYYTLSNNEDPTLAKTTTAYIACDNQCDYIFNIGGNAQVFKVDGIVDNKYHKTILVNYDDYYIPNGPRVYFALDNVRAYIGNPSFVVGSVVDSNGTNHDYIVKEYTNSNNITYKVTFSKKTNDKDWIYNCYLVEIVVQEE